MQYVDKHGNEIKARMFIRHDDGDIQLVYAGTNDRGEETLGVSASFYEIYPFSEFRLSEWEIISDEEAEAATGDGL